MRMMARACAGGKERLKVEDAPPESVLQTMASRDGRNLRRGVTAPAALFDCPRAGV
jgi:hypothetical protein